MRVRFKDAPLELVTLMLGYVNMCIVDKAHFRLWNCRDKIVHTAPYG